MNGSDAMEFSEKQQRKLSEAQLAANRANAQKSTGPRTEEGKAASAMNAVTHGLLSRFVLLPGEDPDELDDLREGMFAHFKPVGTFEGVLVDRMVAMVWRLRRAGQIESFVMGGGNDIESALQEIFPGVHDPGAAFAQIRRRGKWVNNIMRYETTLERSLYRTRRELERIQIARMGIAAPVNLDVTIKPRSNAPTRAPSTTFDAEL